MTTRSELKGPRRTPEEKISRAHHAAALLDDPLLCEALQHIEDRCLHIWRTSGPEEKEQREDVWRQVRALDLVRTHLRSAIETGKLAAMEGDPKANGGRGSA
jgi:hypothetical protein